MGTHRQQIVAHRFLITGTTRGIGQALAASALGQANSFVVSLSREASFLKGNHQNIPLDLNHTGEIGQALTRVQIQKQQTARLTCTVLINNAGVLDPIAPIGDCDDQLLVQNSAASKLIRLLMQDRYKTAVGTT